MRTGFAVSPSPPIPPPPKAATRTSSWLVDRRTITFGCGVYLQSPSGRIKQTGIRTMLRTEQKARRGTRWTCWMSLSGSWLVRRDMAGVCRYRPRRMSWPLMTAQRMSYSRPSLIIRGYPADRQYPALQRHTRGSVDRPRRRPVKPPLVPFHPFFITPPPLDRFRQLTHHLDAFFRRYLDPRTPVRSTGRTGTLILRCIMGEGGAVCIGQWMEWRVGAVGPHGPRRGGGEVGAESRLDGPLGGRQRGGVESWRRVSVICQVSLLAFT